MRILQSRRKRSAFCRGVLLPSVWDLGFWGLPWLWYVGMAGCCIFHLSTCGSRSAVIRGVFGAGSGFRVE